ncbi:patatin-like phospholipase family protein [uncultured Sphingomonas sp.]|uniref:patatin-like phospholipase family protein n=1 Tax=uncultured Sphingomonas sp. TaxID=158754 RepID=UPI0035C9EE69
MADRPYRTALVLSGGNALGSWQAGAFAALAERGATIDWVIGASAGSINAAMIAGNPPGRAVERLQAFWTPAAGGGVSRWPAEIDTWRRTAAVSTAMAIGRPNLFAPRPFFGEFWAGGGDGAASIFDTGPLAATLDRSVDWDRIASGPMRLSIAAVDLESGADALFDSTRDRLGPDHVRASSALLPAFPPIAIRGRRYVDAGLSANLPVDAVLADPGPGPLLVIALDLLPLSSPVPRSIGEAAGRMQDLVFAAQSRRSIDAWSEVYRLHGDRAPTVTLARLAFADQSREVAGKAFDFSAETAGGRWAAGAACMASFLDRLDGSAVAIGGPGLTVYQNADEAPIGRAGFRLSAERDG